MNVRDVIRGWTHVSYAAQTAVRLNVNENQLATDQSSNDREQHSRYQARIRTSRAGSRRANTRHIARDRRGTRLAC